MELDLATLKQIKSILEDLLNKLEIKADISTKVADNLVFVNISNVKPDSSLLLGKSGETMLALQLILSLIVSRKIDTSLQIVLDVEGYREKREKTLTVLAHKVAKEVREKQERVVLEPMRPFERRIIHMLLQNEYPDLSSESLGEDPYRKIIISPKSNE